jgi:hypothetical protein
MSDGKRGGLSVGLCNVGSHLKFHYGDDSSLEKAQLDPRHAKADVEVSHQPSPDRTTLIERTGTR